MILHDCDFNPQIDRQAEDRCHRLGQTRPVTVYRFVTRDSVDEKIVAIAERKLQLDSAILNAAGDEGDAAQGAAAGGRGAESKSMAEILRTLLEEGRGGEGRRASAGVALHIPDAIAD